MTYLLLAAMVKQELESLSFVERIIKRRMVYLTSEPEDAVEAQVHSSSWRWNVQVFSNCTANRMQTPSMILQLSRYQLESS